MPDPIEASPLWSLTPGRTWSRCSRILKPITPASGPCVRAVNRGPGVCFICRGYSQICRASRRNGGY